MKLYVRALIVSAILGGGLPSWLWAQDNYISVVQEEKQKLVDAGFRFHVSSGDQGSEQGRCDAAQITWRVAKRLADSGVPVGLVYKNPGQKGCTAPNGQRYSHDALVFAGTGACRDILQSSETENIPAWNVCDQAFMDPGLYRPPFALDAGNPPQSPPPVSTVPQPPPVIVQPPASAIDLSHLATKEDLARLEQKVDAVKEDTAAVRSGMNKAWRLIGKYGPMIAGAIATGWFAKPEDAK